MKVRWICFFASRCLIKLRPSDNIGDTFQTSYRENEKSIEPETEKSEERNALHSIRILIKPQFFFLFRFRFFFVFFRTKATCSSSFSCLYFTRRRFGNVTFQEYAKLRTFSCTFIRQRNIDTGGSRQLSKMHLVR
jgi:hypothetical protein